MVPFNTLHPPPPTPVIPILLTPYNQKGKEGRGSVLHQEVKQYKILPEMGSKKAWGHNGMLASPPDHQVAL